VVDVVSSVEIDIPLPSSSNIGALPSVTSIRVTPSVVDPGVSIGQRASITVTLRDHQYPLAGTSFSSGTFWGKMRAFRRSLQGLPLRIIRQVDDEVTTHHFVVESVSRNAGDLVSIVAKDLLKIADGDRSQAPAASHGRLESDIDEFATALTLTPAGIGNLEYPVSVKCAIGGSEICSFTRAADVMTLARAQSGTEAKSHDADEVVQLVLTYTSESPADIVYDLLANYTEIDPAWLPLADWQADIDSYIGRLYSAEIATPTAVKTLLDELMEQMGLVIWWDDVEQKVRLKSLRPVSGARVISTDEMMADSFSFQEQPAKRVSEIWTFFALRNPLAKLDDTTNYRSTLVTVDPDSDADYGQSAIRKIFSRWIAINNRPAASRLNAMQIARYRDPPRKFSFDLYITSVAPSLGDGLELEHWSLQDDTGATITAPVQVTSIERDEDRLVIDAEEMLFSDFVDVNDPDGGSDSKIIIIDSDVDNINLRTLFDSFYTSPQSYDSVIIIIENGVTIGSTDAEVPALDVGSWPANVDILIRQQGQILGKGGYGGDGGGVFTIPTPLVIDATPGQAGGTAFFTSYPVTLDNEGEIYAGGGGGGAGAGVEVLGPGGGGGAGLGAGGSGVNSGTAGTANAGGAAGGPEAGAGGSLGSAGGVGSGSAGGAAGVAIDGVSLVTFDSVGTIIGSQIN
jgi:hypothetical protein